MDSIRFNKNKYVFTSVPAMLLIGKNSNMNNTKAMADFLAELSSYEVIFKDLFTHPLSEDKRNIVLNIAYYLLENGQLNEKLVRRKKLPVRELSVVTRIGQNNLTEWSDYIIAYYIILSNPDYKCIQDHLKIKLKTEDNVINIVNKKYPVQKGVAIKVSGRYAYIITASGEFIKVKSTDSVNPGDVCEGKPCNGISKFNVPIAITLVFLIFIGCATIVEYRRTESIILIETSSKIKLHVNKFNKIIYTYSPTERGEKLIESVNIENNDVDDSVAKIFQYAVDNDMIDKSKKTLITITGKSIEYGALSETNKVVSKNKIPIVINNSGSQQKMPEYKLEEE